MVMFHYDERRKFEALYSWLDAPFLNAFMTHAELPLDINPVENAGRPFTQGRRNWLYSASPRGAHSSAFMYSLVEKAKACGLEPRAYLQALFERYPQSKTVERHQALLPMVFENS